MPETKIVFDAADDYERSMGAWSRALGEKFLAWLDVSCGTGAFSELILRRCAATEAPPCAGVKGRS